MEEPISSEGEVGGCDHLRLSGYGYKFGLEECIVGRIDVDIDLLTF
jgi:hypothetical protein